MEFFDSAESEIVYSIEFPTSRRTFSVDRRQARLLYEGSAPNSGSVSMEMQTVEMSELKRSLRLRARDRSRYVKALGDLECLLRVFSSDAIELVRELNDIVSEDDESH